MIYKLNAKEHKEKLYDQKSLDFYDAIAVGKSSNELGFKSNSFSFSVVLHEFGQLVLP